MTDPPLPCWPDGVESIGTGMSYRVRPVAKKTCRSSPSCEHVHGLGEIECLVGD